MCRFMHNISYISYVSSFIVHFCPVSTINLFLCPKYLKPSTSVFYFHITINLMCLHSLIHISILFQYCFLFFYLLYCIIEHCITWNESKSTRSPFQCLLLWEIFFLLIVLKTTFADAAKTLIFPYLQHTLNQSIESEELSMVIASAFALFSFCLVFSLV